MTNESQEPKPPPAISNTYRLESSKGDADYTAKDLEHLSDLEHVRERPSMYIADTTARGLHHLVYEVVDNSIDEAMAGFATEISVTINNDGSVTVEDNGRGIPVEHPSRPGLLHAPRRDDRAEVRRQVQEGRLPNLRRSARRRRHRGQLPLRVVRGRSPPRRATSISRSTSAACRSADVRRIGTQRSRRHEDHLQARPADLPQHQVPLQHPLHAACRNWPSSIAA